MYGGEGGGDSIYLYGYILMLGRCFEFKILNLDVFFLGGGGGVGGGEGGSSKMNIFSGWRLF